MRTLIIAPHMDDEAISCGGLIQDRLSRGYELFVTTVYGRVYDYGQETVEQTIDAEEQDFHKARETLGYKYYSVLNLREGEPFVLGYYPLLKEIEASLQLLEPTEVVIPGKEHLNQDHRHLADICGIALRPFNLGTVKRVLEFLPLDGTVHRPTYFVPLTQEQMEVKLTAIAAYRREARTVGPRAEENVMAQAMLWGSMCGHKLAEAYKLVMQRD